MNKYLMVLCLLVLCTPQSPRYVKGDSSTSSSTSNIIFTSLYQTGNSSTYILEFNFETLEMTFTETDPYLETVTDTLQVSNDYVDLLTSSETTDSYYYTRYFFQNNSIETLYQMEAASMDLFVFLSNSVNEFYNSNDNNVTIIGFGMDGRLSVANWNLDSEIADFGHFAFPSYQVDGNGGPPSFAINNQKNQIAAYFQLENSDGLGSKPVFIGFESSSNHTSSVYTFQSTAIDYKHDEVYPFYANDGQLYLIAGDYYNTNTMYLYSVQLNQQSPQVNLKLIYTVPIIVYHGGTPAVLSQDQQTLLFFGYNNASDYQFVNYNLNTGSDSFVEMNFKLSKQLLGHSKDVRSICILPDGRIITGSRDHSIIAWDSLNNYSKVILHGHSHFVGAVTALSSNMLLPERIFASGGNDKIICVWEKSAVPKAPKSTTSNNNNNNNNSTVSEQEVIEGGSPSLTLIGHSDSISTLGSTQEGQILSGSWDKTIKIWEGNECVSTLTGHEAAVWSVLSLPNGDIVSASADKTIKIWRKDANNAKVWKVYKTLTEHKDCVRGLALVPELGFLSCANDGLLMVWTFEGELIHELRDQTGQSSFVYQVAVVPGVGFASVGEDRTLRIWKDSECIQTITHPSGVWCVAVHPNGDLVTGCADGVARVWTRAPSRFADPDTVQAFEDQLGAQTIQSDNVGDIKLNELPDLTALEQPGKKDGELKVVKNGKTAEAHQWSSTELKWVKIGEVVDSNASKSSNRGVLQGKEYDYIFDIDVNDGTPFKLGYNIGENPYEVAQNFLLSNDLNQEFLDQVAQFIIKNTNQQNMVFPATPIVNSGDPFTGANRYIPGGGSGSVPPLITTHTAQKPSGSTEPTKFIPQGTYSYFETPHSDAVITKVIEFNSQLKTNEQYSKFALDDDEREIELVKGILSKLKDTSRYHSSSFSDEQYKVVFKMLKWPEDKVFAILEIVRLLVLHPSASKTFEQFIQQNSTNVHTNLIQSLLQIPSNVATIQTNQQLLCKIFSNMMRHDSLRNVIYNHMPTLTERFSSLYSQNSTNKTFSLSYITLLLNFSILAQYQKPHGQIIKQLIKHLESVIMTETEKDLLFRGACALGTLLITFRDEKLSNYSDLEKKLSPSLFDNNQKDSITLLFNLARQ
ncbi:hypothetical protein DLAC_07565 [Tieghemostelium lacteum]|uniref:Phospholipase A-2-activating protein n=1 Tax=Tieghemostelium lacteum TaxID=361077 RepID=A0A151ZCU7_TIELA|nr:hypothetical protein DLAC_07565 [Tieghemostelium lacteum]|eukprot:KYQ91773.1 hypothetical protein DLAC_07565 [Tieghemostelium lacteum]